MILIKVCWLNYFHVRACGYFALFFTILFTLSPNIPTKPKLSIMRAMCHNLVGKGSKPVRRMPLQCVKTEVKSGAVFESVTVFCTKEAMCWRLLRIDVLWEGLSKLVISPECEVWKCSSIPTDCWQRHCPQPVIPRWSKTVEPKSFASFYFDFQPYSNDSRLAEKKNHSAEISLHIFKLKEKTIFV